MHQFGELLVTDENLASPHMFVSSSFTCLAEKYNYWVKRPRKDEDGELDVTIEIGGLGIYNTIPKVFSREIVPCDSNGYFNAFSHQMWNTQIHGLFARLATIEYMKFNERAYEVEFSKEHLAGSLSDFLDKQAKPIEGSIFYPYPSEYMIRASCDLFRVKLERLDAYGSRVFTEVHPFMKDYHKEISMSFMCARAYSMFFADNMPRPSPPRLPDDRISQIWKSGCLTSDDISGSHRYLC